MMRFTPLLTRDMHIGDLHIALLNYLVAKQYEKSFLVRFNDTDKEHVIEGKDTEIMQILEKFAIIPDRVYHQSEHLHLHQTLSIRLLKEGKAYICTCESDTCCGTCMESDTQTYARLKESGESFVIRAKKPEKSIVITDLKEGKTSISPEEVGSFVILRKDATPSALFAAACDDMFDNITLVIRQEEEREKTPKEVHIKQLLGYEDTTTYLHLSPLHYEKNGEIGQTDDTGSLLHLFEQGFIPDAIINYLLFLSTPDAPRTIFYFPDILQWFDLEKIPATPVTFHIETLREINREHLRMMDDKLLSSLFGFADADIGKLAKIYLTEAATINQLAAKIRPILASKSFKGVWAKQMRQIQQVLIDAPMFDTFDDLQAYVTEATGLQGEKLETPLRLLLTGAQQGPDLQDIYPYIRSYLLEVIS